VKSSSAVLAVAVLTLGLSALAIPAQAAAPALPSGDKLVAASCDADFGDATFLSLDTATGTSTPVGASNESYRCAYQASWDETTDTLYGFIYDSSATLVAWEYTTGTLAEIGDFHDVVNDTAVYPDTMVIGLDGAAYALSGNALYSIDLTNAEVQPLGTLAGLDTYSYGASVDPSTGVLYFLQQDGDLFIVDPLAVTATFVATWPISEDSNWSYGIAIDSAGTAWVVESPGDGTYSALWSTPLASFGVDPQLSGNIVDADGADPVTWWATIISPDVAPAPAPALAATGLDVAPLAFGGLLLAAAGALLVARRSRRAA